MPMPMPMLTVKPVIDEKELELQVRNLSLGFHQSKLFYVRAIISHVRNRESGPKCSVLAVKH